MTATKKETPYQIIRHRGTPREGILPDGFKVYAKDKFWMDEYNAFIPVAPYDEHFIYEVPERYVGSTLRCSCGSFSCVVGLSGYVLDASPQGKLIVCHYHATHGVHMGGSKWV
jgi:hypothetical protein